jgi:hypothetical protein
MLSSHISVEITEMDAILASEALVGVCRKLSHGGGSGMNCALDHYTKIRLTENRHIEAKGIFAKLYPIGYIGWALFTREADNYQFMPIPGRVGFQIYVDLEHRRRGIGCQLFQRARDLLFPHEQLHVYLYGNPQFFQPFKDRGLCSEVY